MIKFYLNCDKTCKIKLWQNFKTKMLTKLKNLNSDKTQFQNFKCILFRKFDTSTTKRCTLGSLLWSCNVHTESREQSMHTWQCSLKFVLKISNAYMTDIYFLLSCLNGPDKWKQTFFVNTVCLSRLSRTRVIN